MSLYRTPRSPYWQYDFTWKGHRVYGSTRCRDKRDAAKVESDELQKLVERLSGGKPKKPPLTLDEAAGLYEDKVGAKPCWKDDQGRVALLLEGLGAHKLLSDIGQADLLAFVAKRRNGRVNASVNREIETWRALWRWAARNRFDVGEMPDWGALLLPVKSKPPRELASVEETDLFAGLREDFQPFARFALLSGWRLAEVRHLRWEDVNLRERIATTRIKGGDVVTRPLTAEMVALIANQPRAETTEGRPHVFTYVAQRNKPAFVTKDGRKNPRRIKGERYPFTGWGWRRPWGKALREAGIDAFRFHDLRHTRGTRILRATGNIAAAKNALAHKSIKTTLRYAHAFDEDVRRALEESENSGVSRTITGAESGDRQKA